MTAEGPGHSDPVRARVARVQGAGCAGAGGAASRRREWQEARVTLEGEDGETYVEAPSGLLRTEVVGKGPLLAPPPPAPPPAPGAPAPAGGAPVVPTARGRRAAGVGAALRRLRGAQP